MNWRAIDFDWNRVKSFLVAAEEGSFSAAAQALGVSQPTVGRQIAALEKELKVALFERVGRGLMLTPHGHQLVKHVKAMAEAAGQVSLLSSGHAKSLEGTVRVSVSEVVGALLLPDIIKRLREAQPGIELELLVTVEESDLRRREADIAVRLNRPEQPDLVTKRIAATEYCPYATPDFLKRRSSGSDGSDFSNTAFIGSEDNTIITDILREKGIAVTQKNFPIRTNSRLAQWELTKRGLGIGMMPREIGDYCPGVVRALPEFEPIPVDMWLVVHRELRTNLRIRTVFDFLHRELTQALMV